MGVDLLHYRPWRGRFRATIWSVWPITRVALIMMFRHKLFWVLYALGLIFFLMFFFFQYMLSFTETRVGLWLARVVRDESLMNGSGVYYRAFFTLLSATVMMVLALAGAVIVGNDFRWGGLPFYLSKPLTRWHYLLGKCLAVAVFVNLMTTVPALVLYVQYGLLTKWEYFVERYDLALGILGYGLVLTVVLSLILVSLASWLRRTMPLIMAWTALFVFLRLVSDSLVLLLEWSPRWRLMNLWGDLCVVGNACLGLSPESNEPAVWEASLVLAGVCAACLGYLAVRLRAVEIVR